MDTLKGHFFAKPIQLEGHSPGFPQRGRGRIGVKAAHTRAASRSQSLDTGS